jgi:hypothetical protein
LFRAAVICKAASCKLLNDLPVKRIHVQRDFMRVHSDERDGRFPRKAELLFTKTMFTAAGERLFDDTVMVKLFGV